ncbi:MAG: hypothetical protein HN350_17060 [Phycisphaerales bacterium]|jgi:Ca2+-binding EF-hand superfamily protein|nr:hypothetical protein [Phycisphaerales bacterium]
MKQLTTAIVIVLVAGSIALGQAKDAKKPEAKPIPDLCKGVIDPYDVSGEKALFYASAGVDNELTSAEFAAAKGKDKTFARKFDSWRTLITFDKGDKNGTVDWTEASEYRQSTRRKVMGSFDKNKDGKLTGEERTAANKALASGRLSLSSRQAARDARTAKWRADMLAKYDTDKDGSLSDTEKAAARKAYEQQAKERMEKWRKERELREHDTDKDGKLNETEAAAAAKQRAESDKRRAEYEKRRAEFIKKYDTNGDGRINGDEWKTARPAMMEAMQKRVTAQYDTNKDGELDDDEKAAMAKAHEKRREEYRKRYEVRRFDKDKDGSLNAEEGAARDKWRKDYEAERAKRHAAYIKQYDKNGDGEVDDKERPSRSRGRRGRGGGDRGGRDGGR